MKKSVVKLCVMLALSASVVFGGVAMVQATYDDVACGYVIGFRPFDLPDENYD